MSRLNSPELLLRPPGGAASLSPSLMVVLLWALQTPPGQHMLVQNQSHSCSSQRGGDTLARCSCEQPHEQRKSPPAVLFVSVHVFHLVVGVRTLLGSCCSVALVRRLTELHDYGFPQEH